VSFALAAASPAPSVLAGEQITQREKDIVDPQCGGVQRQEYRVQPARLFHKVVLNLLAERLCGPSVPLAVLSNNAVIALGIR
jgi:hypothetical protein